MPHAPCPMPHYPLPITHYLLPITYYPVPHLTEKGYITGRFDLLAIDKNTLTTTGVPFWILVIETKNSLIDVLAGLPQLLTYAYKSLEYQTSAWGLVTNGARYQFAYIQSGNPPTFQLMPLLNSMDCEPSIQILQVLKALCKLQNTPLGN